MYTDESDLGNTESQPPSRCIWARNALLIQVYNITKEVSAPPL
jgi:hypothetical protein